MAIATAPNQTKWTMVPADFEPDVTELDDDQVSAEIWQFRQTCYGADLFASGGKIEDCENDYQRRGFRQERRFAENAWRYAADAATDSYMVRNGASPMDLDAIRDRVGARR